MTMPSERLERSRLGQSILSQLDTAEVSEAARRESRNREVHLPPLSVFRWWARRTAAVNDAVLTAANQVMGDDRLAVLDPFAGGGTIPLVVLRAGHRVHAQDLNPWATYGIARMLSLPPADELAKAEQILHEQSASIVRDAYSTVMEDGREAALVHTYRVAVGDCGACGASQRLFPYSLLTLKYRKERRRPEAVFACRCGHVFEGLTDKQPKCPECSRRVDPTANYNPRRISTCVHCGHDERLSDKASRSGWGWEVVMVERGSGRDREFGTARPDEIERADRHYPGPDSLGVIPVGSDTSVLLRHGFLDWADLYPARQRFVTQALLDLASSCSDSHEVVEALRIAIVGTTEFAGHLCRWDRFYLKCNDVICWTSFQLQHLRTRAERVGCRLNWTRHVDAAIGRHAKGLDLARRQRRASTRCDG